MMLISFILITFVGQLEILAYEIDEELLPFEFQEKSLPMSDELANDAGRRKPIHIPVQYVTTENINGKDREGHYFTARLCGGCPMHRQKAVIYLNLPNRRWSERNGDILKVKVMDMKLNRIATNQGKNGKWLQEFNFTYYSSYGDLRLSVLSGPAPRISYTISLTFSKLNPIGCKLRGMMNASEVKLERHFHSVSQKGRTHDLVPIFTIVRSLSVPTTRLAWFKLHYCFPNNPPYSLTITTTALNEKSGFATYVCPQSVGSPCTVNTKLRDTSGAAVNVVPVKLKKIQDLGPIEVLVRGDGRFRRNNNFTLAASMYRKVRK